MNDPNEALSTGCWLLATALAYVLALTLHRRARQHPLVNTVAVAVTLLVALVLATHTAYLDYARRTRLLSMVLGPGTVALGLPLYRSLGTLRSAFRPVLIGLFAGAVSGVGSALVIARALGASPLTVRSLAPKSVTTPIAIAVSARLGGSPPLTAALVILTGMLGAMAVPWVFRLVRVDDARARGLAIGVAAHGIGTARALALGGTEGAFSALGMGLSAVVTPLLLPLVERLLP